MAQLVQLDKAAKAAGKSEITLRRLIKAGKIPFEKQKTLTGFIYLVDPQSVKDFYGGKSVKTASAAATDSEKQSSGEKADQPQKAQSVEKPVAKPIEDVVEAPKKVASPDIDDSDSVRLAVAGESGEQDEYWRKKAELYEKKYHEEAARHTEAREALGTWRGRAEHAQAMLMKMLPASAEAKAENKKEDPKKGKVTEEANKQVATITPSLTKDGVVDSQQVSLAAAIGWVFGTLALLGLLGSALYWVLVTYQ
jgi:hypothetical protein